MLLPPDKERGNNMARLKGKVAWFSNAKGYGFLSRDSGPDVFFHYSAIQVPGYKTLHEGDSVEFTLELGPAGREQAASVTPSK